MKKPQFLPAPAGGLYEQTAEGQFKCTHPGCEKVYPAADAASLHHRAAHLRIKEDPEAIKARKREYVKAWSARRKAALAGSPPPPDGGTPTPAVRPGARGGTVPAQALGADKYLATLEYNRAQRQRLKAQAQAGKGTTNGAAQHASLRRPGEPASAYKKRAAKEYYDRNREVINAKAKAKREEARGQKAYNKPGPKPKGARPLMATQMIPHAPAPRDNTPTFCPRCGCNMVAVKVALDQLS